MKQANSKITATEAARPRVRITDTTLRDAHQSLWATRLRTDDILAIADEVDRAGYYSLECWGGATFDVCMRFLRENPWERLRRIKAVCQKTPLQMLLRGQNVLGYKHYPDDIVERTVALACENGMDIFRVFDALNDPRNLEKAITSVKKYGGHAQGTISYTVSPVHTIENFVNLAREMSDMGIDSLCIKDMAGILTPGAARKLVGALVKALPEIPIQIHSHMTSGMAAAMYLASVEAGAGCVDTAISTMSSFSSQPPTESMVTIFESEGYETGVDHGALGKINAYFKELKLTRQPASSRKVEPVDAGVLIHNIPGGMISNLRSQLAQQNALDRLPEVLEELPKTRADMGYPPLVTPTSQIVGVQSVLNVLGGKRYGMVTDETKRYVAGYYGRTPAPVDTKLKTKILKGSGLKQIDCRPADLLPPGLVSAAKELDAKYIQKEEDIISYCMFPEVALGYFKWRAEPEDKKDPIPADVENKPAAPVEAPAPVVPETADEQRLADIGALVVELADKLGFAHGSAPLNLPKRAVSADVPAKKAEAPVAEKPAAPVGETVNAPLNGTFYRSSGPGKPEIAKEGDKIPAGGPVCIVEAMKLFNAIKADKPLTVVRFLVEHGAVVSKGQPLVEVTYQ